MLGGDKAGTTACLKEEVGKAGRRGGGGRESHGKQAPSGVLNKLSPPHVYTSKPPSPRSYLQLQETLRVQFTACAALIIPSPGQEGESNRQGWKEGD